MTAPFEFARYLARSLHDPVSGHLLRGSLTSMTVRVIGLVLAFLSHVLISRILGAGQYGLYSIALGWALILVIPARLGFDHTILRFATLYREEGNFSALRGLVRFAVLITALMSILLTVLLFAGEALGLGLFGRMEPDMIFWVATMIFPLAALGLFSALIRTAKRIFASQLYEQVYRPGLLTIGLAVAGVMGQHMEAVGAMIMTVAATGMALAGIWIHFGKVFPSLRASRPDYRERGLWLSLSWPMLIVSVIQELLIQIDVLLLGYLYDAAEAGLFAASWRLANMVPFALVALTAISGPMIASAHRRDDQNELARIARLNARLAFAFAAVMAMFLALIGPIALRTFGPGFDAGYPALLIQLIGGVAIAFTGAVAYLMTMTGHQNAALPILCLALVAKVIVSFLLIPKFGATGAAVAATVGVLIWTLLMLAYVRRTLGIDASAVALAPRRVGLRDAT